MSTYRFPLEDDEVCPKCGREGCTCGPECDCEPDKQKELIQDFEEQEDKMDNQGHAIVLPNGSVIPWESLKMDAEAKNATNANSSHFQRVTSNEKIQ